MGLIFLSLHGVNLAEVNWVNHAEVKPSYSDTGQMGLILRLMWLILLRLNGVNFVEDKWG
jgi:hypothetical protein